MIIHADFSIDNLKYINGCLQYTRLYLNKQLSKHIFIEIPSTLAT